MEIVFLMEEEALACHDNLLLLKGRWVRKFGNIS